MTTQHNQTNLSSPQSGGEAKKKVEYE